MSMLATRWSGGVDRVYYGTDTRAAELLIGAMLAVLLAHDPARRAIVRRFNVRLSVLLGGVAATVFTLLAWNRVEVDGGFVAEGGLWLVGLGSAALIANGALGIGGIARTLSRHPLRRLGEISYAVYLFHWPILTLMTPARTGLSNLPRFVIAVAVTMVLALLSERLLERPFRRGLPTVRFRPVAVAVPAALALVALSVVVRPDRTRPRFDPSDQAELARRAEEQAAAARRGRAGAPKEQPAEESRPGATATTSPPPPPTVQIYGDSVAMTLAYPFSDWTKASGEAVFGGGVSELGCGIGRGGYQLVKTAEPRARKCDAWPVTWSAQVNRYHPNVTLVVNGQWDIVDRRLAGERRWRHVGDPVYDRYLTDELLTANDLLASDGAMVVWATLPYYGTNGNGEVDDGLAASRTRERVDRYNQLLRDVVAQRPNARLLDLADFIDPQVDDHTIREDGAHYQGPAINRVGSWVGTRIVDLWRRR
ncbi:MAG: acyltransferase family protein [Microthrixaceae bacterium]